jgi:hypothetical protein
MEPSIPEPDYPMFCTDDDIQMQGNWSAFIDQQIRTRDNAKMAFVVAEAKTLPRDLLRTMLLELGQFYEELKE